MRVEVPWLAEYLPFPPQDISVVGPGSLDFRAAHPGQNYVLHKSKHPNCNRQKRKPAFACFHRLVTLLPSDER